MLREIAAPFRALVSLTATAPSAAAGARRAVAAPRRTPPGPSTAIVLLSCAALCGCGIKGPLRMPPPAPAAAPADAAAAPASTASPAAIDPAAKPKAP